MIYKCLILKAKSEIKQTVLETGSQSALAIVFGSLLGRIVHCSVGPTNFPKTLTQELNFCISTVAYIAILTKPCLSLTAGKYLLIGLPKSCLLVI